MEKTKLIGIPICEGLVKAKVKRISVNDIELSENKVVDPKLEFELFQKSIEQSKQQIHSIINEKKSILGNHEIQIFEAHLMFLEDPEYLSQIEDKIINKHLSAAKSIFDSSNEFSLLLTSLPDPYLSARGQDILDIGQRLIRNLNSEKTTNNVDLQNFKGILILKEIFPSFVAELNPKNIQGVISEQGGATSHAAILLKSLEIPTLFGIPNLLNLLQDDDIILMDSRNGFIIIQPDIADQKWFDQQWSEHQKEKELLNSLKFQSAETHDGHRIHLYSNIGSHLDLEAVEKTNSEGIGLFRTEFLFLDRPNAPSEEEQYQSYSKVLKSMNGKKTIIRTIDIGGDKEIPYLNINKEENPFLGLRGLRLCLANEILFRIQIKALLRASVHGNLYIMFPMVSQLAELTKAQSIVREESQFLEDKGIVISKAIRFGIMIEVPSAAIMCESFAKHVDFFSIGTNDLIQYTNACDRINPSVSYLYSHYEPAVLKLIQHVSQIAQQYHIELSLCGEMGGDPNLTGFLIGCGIKNLSMTSHQIPVLKMKLQKLKLSNCQDLAKEILLLHSSSEIKELIKNFNIKA